ncbi:hypothetical protein EMCRGX_G001681 [Ephydatia muelleri]
MPLCLIPLGSAIFTNITNVTTCLGSPAVFTCVITESLPILWLINGTPVQSPPPTTPLTPGPGSQSTLSVNATKELNGTSVQCYYTPSVLLPSIVSPPAYLSVQGPPATITITNTSNVFSNSSRDNVTVKFILPSTPGVCYYTITAKAMDGTPETALDKPCSESGGMINISLSLRPLKHFNVFFTANNAKEVKNATISTFSVINVTASTSGPQCVYYNDHSPAIGCVMHLNNTASNETYCKVVMKDLNIPVNTSICNSFYSNGPLSAGMYIVDAYDIGSDGNVSGLKAISQQTLKWPTAPQGNLTTSASSGSTSLSDAIVGIEKSPPPFVHL